MSVEKVPPEGKFLKRIRSRFPVSLEDEKIISIFKGGSMGNKEKARLHDAITGGKGRGKSHISGKRDGTIKEGRNYRGRKKNPY